jgi:hypothetical protein
MTARAARLPQVMTTRFPLSPSRQHPPGVLQRCDKSQRRYSWYYSNGVGRAYHAVTVRSTVRASAQTSLIAKSNLLC